MSDLGWELSTASVLFHEAVARRLGLTAVEHKALGMIVRGGPLPAGALARSCRSARARSPASSTGWSGPATSSAGRTPTTGGGC
ncbi:hypothetical protein ACFQZ4_04560 [Catellatospora coxensis]